MFFAIQPQKLVFKKRLKHRNLQDFLLLYEEQNTAIDDFLTLEAKKSSQNIGIYEACHDLPRVPSVRIFPRGSLYKRCVPVEVCHDLSRLKSVTICPGWSLLRSVLHAVLT